MLKKGLFTLVCLTVMSAVCAWAATTYSVRTQLTNSGGSIKVGNKAAQTAGIAYTNCTTAVTVVVTPNAGFKISALKQINGAVVTDITPADGTVAIPVDIAKPIPVDPKRPAVLKAQGLTATFASTNDVVVPKTWQLQLTNTNRGGTITTNGAKGLTLSSVGLPKLVNYTDATPVQATINATTGYKIKSILSTGAVVFSNNSTVATVTGIPATGKSVNPVVATYKLKAYTVATNAGIAPANPAVAHGGTVRVIVTPTLTNNKVTDLVVSGGTVALTDRFGAAVTLPFQGPVKATISNITSDITVTAVYGTDTTAAMEKNCTSTCHLNASAATQAVPDQWLASAHKANGVDCVTCHQTMPGPVLTEALCAGCHAAGATPSARHTADHNVCSTCHSFGNSHNPVVGETHPMNLPINSCAGCHDSIAADFATSQHGTRQGKATWYTDNIGNAVAPELQKGFGNYVLTAYTALPCGKCHNAAAWTPTNGTDQWATLTGGKSVCVDCHGNRRVNANTTVADAPVNKDTCLGCHSRQANEASAGLTDVHTLAGMGCMSCHSTADMHGTGTQTASQLVFGTISAQCENCHGEGKARGPISTIAAHTQHAGNIACATCHTESMITCHNCHFDNEAGAGGAKQAKFFSGKFGGTHASGNSWRFLVNRVMPDGSTKIYPGSMQSLVADYTTDDLNDGQGHTHAGIAPYYSHTITRVNALTCDKCHGIESAVKLAAGVPVRVTTWTAAANVEVAAADVATTFVGPKGVIPVPENPRGKLLMDFVDLVNPEQGTASKRVLFQKDGPDTIHMPEAYVKPLTAAQMEKLANPYREGMTTATTAHADAVIGSNDLTEHTSCAGCHAGVASMFSTSQHGTRQGKATWYTDNLNNPEAVELQKGFGNYVQTAYTALPCGKCHAAAAWTVAGVDQWVASTGGVSVCTDCHGNKAAGIDQTTVYAPVTKGTCFGCHSRQGKEAAAIASGGAGLTDVHFLAGMGCSSCHSTTDMHGNGTQTATQLQWGTISAQCENCHGAGKSQGALTTIAAHVQHVGDIACATCHVESMITCHNCHFDNEAGAGDAAKAKFGSGFFGGTAASGNSWRFLVNRVMPDGTTKIYPGSMQSLVADHTADGSDDDLGHTHAGIAPYYSHSITKVNALTCDKCHGIESAVKLAAGQPVRVTTWNAAAGVEVAASAVQTTFVGPKGVIPVPENPTGLLLMDFVDLVDPNLGTASKRVLFQKDGPDSIHMPEAYVKPLTALQMQKLANVQLDHNSAVVTASASPEGQTANTCNGCHASTNKTFATSLHGTRDGKATFYNNNLGNAAAEPLQKGFGNYVDVAYDDLPCAACHNAAAWKIGGVDTWPGTPVCTDCHTNRTITNGELATTAFDAPVAKDTCLGCHSRQKTETAQGLTDVHTSGATINGTVMNFGCATCHSTADMHGDGNADATQLATGAVSANCENCHTTMVASITPEHTFHLTNIACSTCHMESVITCYGCHFDNEASDPADSTILHAKFASGKFGGTGAAAWRFLVNRVMPDGSTKIYPASMQSLVADRTASNAPGEDNAGWTHAAIAPYYSHSITRVNALKCDKCHGIQNAIDLDNGVPIRVVKWDPSTITYPTGEVPVSALGAGYTVKPSGVIPVPENPVGKLLMDFVDLVNPEAKDANTYPGVTPGLNAGGTSISKRKLFKADGPDSIHMPEAYTKPLTAAQITKLATPQARP